MTFVVFKYIGFLRNVNAFMLILIKEKLRIRISASRCGNRLAGVGEDKCVDTAEDGGFGGKLGAGGREGLEGAVTFGGGVEFDFASGEFDGVVGVGTKLLAEAVVSGGDG